MSGEVTCAAAGCDNPVARRHGQPGRPPIYCSPACRPSRKAYTALVVEVAHCDGEDDDGEHGGRDWIVWLRRANRSIVVGRDLGRFTAMALAAEMRSMLGPTRQNGGAIE